MHYFKYRGNHLYCEQKKIRDIVNNYETPLYIYSAKTILEHYRKIKKAFSSIDPLICYSVKANSNLSILKLLVREGSGLDIVSGGELYRAQKVNCNPQKIVYASVGKTDREIRNAAKSGILLFNVESPEELVRINHIASQAGRKFKVALRINPDIESGTHKYITTGRKETKFGMDIETVKGILNHQEIYPSVDICGLHLHIGSQITTIAPYVKAIKKVKNLIQEVGSEVAGLRYLDIGGGWGIVYDQEKPHTAKSFAKHLIPLLKQIGLKVILEPGRFILGNAGVFITKVLYVKESYRKQFIVVDGAMNDFLRPSLYSAYHKIIPLAKKHVKSNSNIRGKKADVVGPICESGDFLGKERNLSVVKDDYLAVLGAGAYGFSMSSNYNSRPRPAEVLVKGKRAYLICQRQMYPDLIEKEKIV